MEVSHLLPSEDALPFFFPLPNLLFCYGTFFALNEIPWPATNQKSFKMTLFSLVSKLILSQCIKPGLVYSTCT